MSSLSLKTNHFIEEGFIQTRGYKVVAAVWEKEFIQFLAALAV